MKKLLYILIILSLFSCKHSAVQNELSVVQLSFQAPATSEVLQYKIDSLTKISKPFALNNMLCYWKHFFVVYNYGDNNEIVLDITMNLKDYKTGKMLLEWEFSPKHAEDYNYKNEHYFDTINKKHFDDVNFDGYKDFVIYSHGSMPMTSLTNIYIFNKETKAFDRSDLSDTVIEEQDSINKILITSSWDMEARYIKRHHFDRNGKIKYSEQISEKDLYLNDNLQQLIRTSIKTVKGEVITKIDTINID